MHKAGSSFATLAAVLVALVFAAPAQAAFATFFSPAGNNANNCTTPATACATLGGAFAKTDAGGVMHVLPGEYSTLNITKAVQIIAEAGQASISGSSTGVNPSASFLVTAGATDEVRIRGFVVDRHGSSAGGIALVTGAALYVEDCSLVSSGNDFGIIFVPTGASELYVSNSFMSGNASPGGGILVKPSGSGSAKVVLDNVNVENNAAGILIDGRVTTGSNTVVIGNTNVVGGGSFGIFAADSGGGTTNVTVDGSTSANNVTFGIGASGANATVRVRNSIVTGNGTGLQIASSGKLISHGGNVVTGNTTNGAFTSTVAQQ